MKTRICSIVAFVLVALSFAGLMEWTRMRDEAAKAQCFSDARHASVDWYIAQQLYYGCSMKWDVVGDFWRIYGN